MMHVKDLFTLLCFCVRLWHMIVFPLGDGNFPISALKQSTAEKADTESSANQP